MADNADHLNQLSKEQREANKPAEAPVAEAPVAPAPARKAPVKES